MSAVAALVSPGSRLRRMRAPALTLAGLALAGLALHLRDPHVGGSWGTCPSAALGIACPGCGTLRAVHDLTNLDLAAAASSNLAFVIALPLAAAVLVLWSVRRWRGRAMPDPATWPRRPALASAVLGAVLLVAFTVARNLPGSWLAP